VSNLYLGLISGTSVDAIDAALVRFEDARPELIGTHAHHWDAGLSERLNALIESPAPAWRELGSLHIETGRAFAAAALAVLERCGIGADEVAAIGHHGQTIHHAPDGPAPFTIQIGDPNTVAALTGITTVADLRGFDMAVGGQGAPLVPIFHEQVLRSTEEHRVVVNIGGISNITTLTREAPITGCDTGPGNTLLDAWIRRHRGERFDRRGEWAASGTVDSGLLDLMLREPWFALPAPKSTGRELFNAEWLNSLLAKFEKQPSPGDVQATLTELTAVTIARHISELAPHCQRVIVCGGGAFNDHLMARLDAHCNVPTESAQLHGIAPDWVEAMAFAWLARARLLELPGNVPSVTGAHQRVILGSIYSGNRKD
jgi:anhydro-N-acetylmuramic acid kinase